jgi:hypothetical protein
MASFIYAGDIILVSNTMSDTSFLDSLLAQQIAMRLFEPPLFRFVYVYLIILKMAHAAA